MKTTKTVTVKENAFGFEIRNNFEAVGFEANLWDAIKAAEKFGKPVKVVRA